MFVQSSLKMSFRFGGDFDSEVGDTGGDKNNPPVEVGDEERNNDELDDDDGRLFLLGEVSGIDNLDNFLNGGGVVELSFFVGPSINWLRRRWRVIAFMTLGEEVFGLKIVGCRLCV